MKRKSATPKSGSSSSSSSIISSSSSGSSSSNSSSSSSSDGSRGTPTNEVDRLPLNLGDEGGLDSDSEDDVIVLSEEEAKAKRQKQAQQAQQWGAVMSNSGRTVINATNLQIGRRLAESLWLFWGENRE